MTLHNKQPSITDADRGAAEKWLNDAVADKALARADGIEGV